jgi:hypothetical protein
MGRERKAEHHFKKRKKAQPARTTDIHFRQILLFRTDHKVQMPSDDDHWMGYIASVLSKRAQCNVGRSLYR